MSKFANFTKRSGVSQDGVPLIFVLPWVSTTWRCSIIFGSWWPYPIGRRNWKQNGGESRRCHHLQHPMKLWCGSCRWLKILHFDFAIPLCTQFFVWDCSAKEKTYGWHLIPLICDCLVVSASCWSIYDWAGNHGVQWAESAGGWWICRARVEAFCFCPKTIGSMGR